MKDCPVCQKKFTNAGLAAHITKRHPEYKLEQTESEIGPPVIDRVSSSIDVNAEKESLKMQIENFRKKSVSLTEEEFDAEFLSKPVYKQTSSRKVRILRKPQVETTQSGYHIIRRKIKREEEPIAESIKPVEAVEFVEPKPMKDPEGALNSITKIPAIVLAFVAVILAYINLDKILQLGDNDIVQLYAFLLSTPTNPISILLLAITVFLIIAVVVIIHRIFWRAMFPDLYLRQFKVVGDQKVFIGSSREARAYLTIGAGRWDRLYRRITKRPRPEVITVYFKDSWRPLLNPFNPINNMEKGYIVDPKHERFVKSGLFRVTVAASHKRRDVENNMPIYWFEDAEADQLPFSEKWYVKSHDNLIDVGLRKVSRATNLDSEVQKAQAEKSLLWLPRQDVDEQYELAKAIEDSRKVIKP